MGTAKLTWREVCEIRLSSFTPRSEVADWYGVSVFTVLSIRNWDYWKKPPILKSVPTPTAKERIRDEVLRRDESTCVVCRATLKPEMSEIGHIIDESIGGAYTTDNLVVMCARCNKLKPRHSTRKEFEEWVLSKDWDRRVMADLTPSVVDRFWMKINKSDGCWIWKGATNNTGYPTFYQAGHAKSAIAPHRYSYWLHFGEIPIGMYVCHHCDNRACVRPDHLYLGTPQQNSDDMKIKGRSAPQGGENNGRSKLTWLNVDAMRLAYKDYGVTARDLSLWYGISNTYVHQILSCKTWKEEYRDRTQAGHNNVRHESIITPDENTLYRIMMKIIKEDNGCWIWNGCFKKDGRPVARSRYRREFSVRRFLWEKHKGDTQTGKAIINRCGNQKCVNPDHHECSSPIMSIEWMRTGFEGGTFIMPNH